MKKLMKKLLALGLAAVMCVGLVACGSTETAAPATEEAATEEAAEITGDATAPGAGATKLGVILVGTRDDFGYNQGLYDCSVGAEEALGLEVMIKESVPEDSSAQAVMEQMIAEGCTIIYATSYGHREYAEIVAANHPEVAFYVTNQTGQEMDNIACLVVNGWDAAYANGVCAGLMTKTNELGYIGSFQIPTVISTINAFTLGAQSVNPDVTVHAVFTGSWSDVGLQTNAVNSMVSQNIDVIAQYQDYTKTIVEMCEAAGVYCVGYHVDTTDIAPNSFIIGALDTFVKQYEVWQDAIDGNFQSSIIRGGYPESMCANTECTSIVPEDVKAQVDEVIESMKSGEFTTFVGPIYNQAGEIAVEEGVTLDELTIDGMDYFVQGVVGLAN